VAFFFETAMDLKILNLNPAYRQAGSTLTLPTGRQAQP